MRLTCPNCGAQYEVPDDVIPAEGRDVQCSNCGDTWFQSHPDAEAAAEIDEAPEQSTAEETPDATEDEAVETFEEVEPPEANFEEPAEVEPDLDGEDWELDNDFSEPTPEEQTLPEDDYDWDLTAEEQEEAHALEAPASEEDAQVDEPQEEETRPKRRGLDPAVADVLRQEAEHEAQVRAEEREALETQAELGLSAPASEAGRRANEARERMRTLRGLQDEDDLAPRPTEIRDSRRDLLPDIEETNSTLRHGGEAPRASGAPEPAADAAKRGRGFRLGFVFVVLIAAAGVFVYGQHESLSVSYPQYESQIDAFVSRTDTARVWLDTKVTNLLVWLTELAGENSEG